MFGIFRYLSLLVSSSWCIFPKAFLTEFLEKHGENDAPLILCTKDKFFPHYNEISYRSSQDTDQEREKNTDH
jgi:hypothetical protein